MLMTNTSNFVLTEDMIEEFYREGYFYAPGFLTQEAVDKINKENTEFATQQSSDGKWKSNATLNLAKSQEQFPETVNFLSNTRIIETFESILGDNVKLWMGMYAVVPPHGEGLAWHQDNMYTHILGHMLNGFVALDHITQENAGLWLAPRSHRLGRQKDLNEVGESHRRAADPDNGAPCRPMAPGDAVIFHRETLHHSKTNHTDRPRRAYAFQVASAVCRYAETGKLLTDREDLSSYKK
ncbi:phytanoyl-CoA dioxygenase family protein [Paenibacillus radicis (ex Xue et al. 2023)]|uniref:Phytanoyl-CoA dioxygenase family protein n=1 Tax=Paenibacillus radicis (ex Xue et al. 2023) TaxID=2972489 RepID=A0ABT1YFT1_9BACL|nr:phytanoyl-CoA dioxygenase family protein [Paenibacillus radicis (ex Xue et al. 2023)]MCR8632051.1 phytanoyl-CoA dioxygenase family protein [Paenibacillus radicis (ex Xue et al. 2023)]